MLQDSDCNHKYCQTQPWNSGEWNIIACYIKGPCKNSHLWRPNIFEYSRNHLLSLIIEQTLSILGQNVQDIMERQTMSKCANFTNILFHGESSADLSHQKALLALATRPLQYDRVLPMKPTEILCGKWHSLYLPDFSLFSKAFTKNGWSSHPTHTMSAHIYASLVHFGHMRAMKFPAICYISYLKQNAHSYCSCRSWADTLENSYIE